MKAIIIGAGRGNRLMPLTDGLPKCLLEIGSKTVLQHLLEALEGGGIDDVVFIGGYQIEKIKHDYPYLRFCDNTDWENNNILTSLMYAEREMDGAFVASYSDIIYRSDVVKRLLRSEADITLVVDTDWRPRYVGRTLHPESQAEKVIVENDKIVQIGKRLDSDEAYGEFIGLAKFSQHGTEILKRTYAELVEEYQDQPFHQAPSIKKAYLTDMIQELIDREYAIHKVDINGNWIEMDTEEDFERAGREFGA